MKFPGIPENEEERLKSLYLADLLDTRDDERFDRLTRLARRIFQVPVVLISLLDRERQWLIACEGLGVRETPRNISFCGHAILQDGAFIVNDASVDERFHDNPLVTVNLTSDFTLATRCICLTEKWQVRFASFIPSLAALTTRILLHSRIWPSLLRMNFRSSAWR